LKSSQACEKKASIANACVSESYLLFSNVALLLWRSANGGSTELSWQRPDAGGCRAQLWSAVLCDQAGLT